MTIDAEGFDQSVALPPGLSVGHIRNAMAFIQEKGEELIDLYYEQANVQSHYDHPGWYIVWRYAIDPTRRMKPGRAVVVWRIDIPFLTKEDWKYEGSKAGQGRGGRTHTFAVRNPAVRLARAVIYQASGIALYRGSPTLVNGPSSEKR